MVGRTTPECGPSPGPHTRLDLAPPGLGSGVMKLGSRQCGVWDLVGPVESLSGPTEQVREGPHI